MGIQKSRLRPLLGAVAASTYLFVSVNAFGQSARCQPLSREQYSAKMQQARTQSQHVDELLLRVLEGSAGSASVRASGDKCGGFEQGWERVCKALSSNSARVRLREDLYRIALDQNELRNHARTWHSSFPYNASEQRPSDIDLLIDLQNLQGHAALLRESMGALRRHLTAAAASDGIPERRRAIRRVLESPDFVRAQSVNRQLSRTLSAISSHQICLATGDSPQAALVAQARRQRQETCEQLERHMQAAIARGDRNTENGLSPETSGLLSGLFSAIEQIEPSQIVPAEERERYAVQCADHRLRRRALAARRVADDTPLARRAPLPEEEGTAQAEVEREAPAAR